MPCLWPAISIWRARHSRRRHALGDDINYFATCLMRVVCHQKHDGQKRHDDSHALIDFCHELMPKSCSCCATHEAAQAPGAPSTLAQEAARLRRSAKENASLGRRMLISPPFRRRSRRVRADIGALAYFMILPYVIGRHDGAGELKRRRWRQQQCASTHAGLDRLQHDWRRL